MTPTKRALNVLNTTTLSQAERNAVIKLAGDFARVEGLSVFVAARHVKQAMQQLGIERKVTR